ncbi:tyrosine-type recombinase/integrase [Parafilimonas terrae]|uniref:Site-specific recombinase XerD n=1 Tax=Parafilimonas terrae TaxID=1465490 RepID=A0A1I5VZC4_9BACT|nr:tyrosine-type recombinase/integrase [Parafilimonas terrae]SFQ12811.1 Site-specific recombinase XerD [Parafilimonas terrae]
MAALTYKIVLHRSKSCILVQFEVNNAWNKRIQAVPGAKWSKTLRGWTIPDTPENRSKCGFKLNDVVLKEQVAPLPEKPVSPKVTKEALCLISEENKREMQKFLEQLTLKTYSPSTIRTYRNEFAQLLQALRLHNVQALQPAQLQRYLLWCIKNGLKENSVHSRLNALKFYFEQVLHRDKFFFEIPRPKKPAQLPKILNETELKRMFASLNNIKHKAILFTAYSAGLRVSEAVKLRIQDIDSKRMEIFVQRAKGKKDRVVNLSPLVLDVLRQYMLLQKPRPVYYLFTNPDGSSPYSERSAQKIFQMARNAAGIHKDVSFHSLRHSFATHLLEKGIDVKYIKELLGHFDIRTTERYLHVSKEKLVNIVSPLDSLYEEEKQLWITDTNNTKKRKEGH